MKSSTMFHGLSIFYFVGFFYNANFVSPRDTVLMAACMLGGLICWVGATILRELDR